MLAGWRGKSFLLGHVRGEVASWTLPWVPFAFQRWATTVPAWDSSRCCNQVANVSNQQYNLMKLRIPKGHLFRLLLGVW